MKQRRTPDQMDNASLHDHLLKECVAMAKYALASGLKVSPGLMQSLEDLSTHRANGSKGDIPGAGPTTAQDQFSSQNGQKETVRRLTQIHTRLAEILAPASPRTILLIENESGSTGILGFLGPVRLIRQMMILAILFLVGLIALGVSPLVELDHINEGIFQSSGFDLLFNLLFVLTAAGLGACFAALFQANRYIANNTFDPKYGSSYWIRIVLGLMAGLILAELIPLDFLGGGEPSGAGSADGNSVQALGKPVLALLGGFSAAAVYRIIARIVDAVESLVRGDTKDIMAAQEQVNRAQFQSQLTETRLSLAASLAKLQQQLGSGADPAQVKLELDRVVNSLVPSSSTDEPS